MKKAIYSILIFIIFISCATTSMLKLTPEEQTYLEKARAFPLEFTILKSEADEAWGRAQSWVGKFSSMKLQIATDFVIQTYNPGFTDVDFGYYVTKTPMGDNVQITVKCITGNWFCGTDAKTNAHILAYYIKTGELSNPRLITR